MPTVPGDGPLGLEARHAWCDLDGTVRTLMGNVSGLPQIKIRDIAGLYDFPDIEDKAEPQVEGIGMVTYPSRARTKNVTYTVEIRCATLQSLRNVGTLVRAAFGPDINTGLNPMRRMVISPHPDYGSDMHTFTGRVMSYSQGSDVQDRGENSVPTPWVRGVVIGIRLYDPRIYEWDGSTASNPKW